MPRTIAIGDIHGCLSALDALLNALDLTPEDTLVTVGDYVDRGPDSKGVIDRLLEIRDRTQLVPLMGNHEEMMLDVLERRSEPYGWLNHGGVQTMESYGFNGDLTVVPDSHRTFLKTLLPYFENKTHFVVHANYEPSLELAEQPVEYLRWIKLTDRLPSPHFSGKHAIVGHTHERQGQIFRVPHLTCIDTHCYGGKWLTAIELESGNVWQASKDGQMITAP
jgi:serine/threonine protein phosphatase 1